MKIVYKILREKDWRAACRKGMYDGSGDDRRDGFIHLSLEEQIEGTAKRFFKNQNNLLLVAFDAEALGSKLCFEPSRDGELFPHYYSQLPTHLALWEKQMFVGKDLVPRVKKERN